MDRLKFAVTLGLVSISPVLLAQEHQNRFETLDVNGNGSISFTEFQKNSIDILTPIDTDDNGVLTIDEFLNARPNRGPRNGNQRGEQIASFQEMDLNGDEVVSVAEFQEANFLRMDRDGNGLLTAEELRPPRGSRSKGRRGARTPSA